MVAMEASESQVRDASEQSLAAVVPGREYLQDLPPIVEPAEDGDRPVPLAKQAGVAPPHSASPAQARQVWVVVLHTGLLPPHCASDRHGTHEPIVVRQTGVAPPHFVTLVAEHWAQAPLAWQAGVALGHSESAPQARQTWVVVLQTGEEPPHWAFEMQGTQVPVVVKQAGVAPPHLVVLVAEH